MATRSYIGKTNSDGTVTYIYCHYDGYPSHHGEILKEHYKTEAKVNALMELGDLSVLGPEIGEKQDFNNTQSNNWCLAYGRDRGESNVSANTAPLEEIIGDQDYTYIYDNGEWRCWGGENEIKL